MYIICIKDTSEYYGNGTMIKKGQIIFYSKRNYSSKIVILKSKNEDYYGLFDETNFITLEEWREQQIDKILNDG